MCCYRGMLMITYSCKFLNLHFTVLSFQNTFIFQNISFQFINLAEENL